jgi:hypothetical protein
MCSGFTFSSTFLLLEQRWNGILLIILRIQEGLLTNTAYPLE